MSINFNGSGYSNYGNYQKSSAKHNPEEFLKQVDTDGDGSISQTEFNAFDPPTTGDTNRPAPTAEMRQQMFTKMDANNDGQISTDELKAHHHHKGKRGAEGSDPQRHAAMQQHRQLVDQAFSQYGLDPKEVFSSVKDSLNGQRPSSPEEMDSTLSQVLQGKGLTEEQATSLVDQIRPPRPDSANSNI